MSQGIHLRKYGVEAVINFELYEIDGVDLKTDAADGGTDCNIMKDQGAEATCDNDFVDEGSGYSITITATEMEAAQVTLYIIDSATKVYLDKVIHIETYGNASAMHAMDFDDAVRGGLTALPNANADAAGGVPISDAGGLDLDTQLATTDQIGAAGVGLTEAGGDGDHLTAINLPNQTMDIVGNITGNLSGTVGTVNALAANVITTASINADAITNAKIADDAIAAENFATDSITTDAMKADALNKIVMSDLATGAPSATASLPVALNWMYESWRNKTTTTATLITIKKDDGSTDLTKSTISDDATTFTKSEFVSG